MDLTGSQTCSGPQADLLCPTPAISRVSSYRLPKPFRHLDTGQVKRGMEGRALSSPAPREPSPDEPPEAQRKPGCRLRPTRVSAVTRAHPARPAHLWERVLVLIWLFNWEDGGMGRGCALLLLPLSHVVGSALALPPSFLEPVFCSPSSCLVLLCVSLAFSLLPSFPQTPLCRIPLCLLSVSVLCISLSCCFGLPLSQLCLWSSVPVSAFLSPWPLPDSGPSHLGRKVNI